MDPACFFILYDVDDVTQKGREAENRKVKKSFRRIKDLMIKV